MCRCVLDCSWTSILHFCIITLQTKRSTLCCRYSFWYVFSSLCAVHSILSLLHEVVLAVFPFTLQAYITWCSTFIEETCFSETFTHGTLSAIIFVFIHFHETIFWGCTLKCFWGRRLGRPNNSQPSNHHHHRHTTAPRWLQHLHQRQRGHTSLFVVALSRQGCCCARIGGKRNTYIYIYIAPFSI